jgi:hypothetical protein
VSRVLVDGAGGAQAHCVDGLLVIGVHTRCSRSSGTSTGVRKATINRRIDHPIVLDSDCAICSRVDLGPLAPNAGSACSESF